MGKEINKILLDLNNISFHYINSSMAAFHLDHDPFMKVFQLMTERTWLTSKSESVIQLLNSCDNDTQQELIISLIKRFSVVTSQDLEKSCRAMARKVVECWGGTSANCRLIAIADEKRSEIDGSQAILNQLKPQFADYDFKEENFISSIGQGAFNIQDGQIAVLFDDFIGSGLTIQGKLRYFLKKIADFNKKDVKIKILGLATMEFTYNQFIEDGYEIYCPILLQKGINGYYKGPELRQKVEDMTLMEDKLSKRSIHGDLKEYLFGFQRSETIFTIEGANISDNVFPIFWWPTWEKGEKRKVMFRRLAT